MLLVYQKNIILVALLILISAQTYGFAEKFDVNLSADAWNAQPNAVSGDQLYRFYNSFTGREETGSVNIKTLGYKLISSGKVAEFSIMGNVPDRRAMVWNSDLGGKDLNQYPYYVIRYKAKGICRDYENFKLINVTGKDSSGKPVVIPLLDSSQIVNDNKWHVIVRKQKLDLIADSMQVRVGTNDSSSAFCLDRLSFETLKPENCGGFAYETDSRKTAKGFEFRSLDLSPQFNDSITAAYDRLLNRAEDYRTKDFVGDGDSRFTSSEIFVNSVPFRVKPEGNNIIHPSEESSANNATVDIFGANIQRWKYKQIARDDVMIIPANGRASEVYLLLVNEFPVTHSPFATSGRTFSISDIEGFAVELQYANEDSELAFPYSIADGGFILRRMMGAYAVPANSKKELKNIVIHNRHWFKSVSVAAVTLNTSPKQFFASIWKEPKVIRVKELKKPAARTAFIHKSGNVLKLGNTYYDITVDCTDGFRITKIVNRWSPSEKISLSPESGLELSVGETLLSGGAFRVEKMDVRNNEANITLINKSNSVPLKLLVYLAVDSSEQLKTKLNVVNIGASQVNTTIKFPYLKNLSIGKLSNTWTYFPQYTNILTNENGFYRTSNDRSFPVQFFDVYNPTSSVGLSYLTHNLDRLSFEYALSKDDKGVNTCIYYPGEFSTLSAGQSTSLPQTNIVMHSGDWHHALSAYKEWLATWYKPVNSQDKSWFRNSFLIKSIIPGEKQSREVNEYPSIIDKTTGQYQIDRLLELDKDYNDGMLADIYHYFNWFVYNDRGNNDWLNYGDWSTASYNNAGGLPAFKAGIQKLQNNYKIPVSIYLYPGPCDKSTDAGKKIGEICVIRGPGGEPLADAVTWNMCLGAKEWQDYFVDRVVSVQRDTGCNLIYLDVFGVQRTLYCYSKDHGHPVPYPQDKGTYDLIKRVREALPKDVAIWSEFPLDDVSSQYADGYLTYNFMHLGRELLSKSLNVLETAPLTGIVLTDAYRYAIPGYTQISLPCGIEGEEANWSEMKQIFFNGQPMQDVTFRLHSTSALNMLNKSLSIKRKYARCFNSDNPSPLVQTEKSGVYANRFPGDGQIVWTLFNSRFTTVDGTVIAVDHIAGDTYFDVWNQKTIKPAVKNGKAFISLKLDPQGLGCVMKISKK